MSGVAEISTFASESFKKIPELRNHFSPERLELCEDPKGRALEQRVRIGGKATARNPV